MYSCVPPQLLSGETTSELALLIEMRRLEISAPGSSTDVKKVYQALKATSLFGNEAEVSSKITELRERFFKNQANLDKLMFTPTDGKIFLKSMKLWGGENSLMDGDYQAAALHLEKGGTHLDAEILCVSNCVRGNYVMVYDHLAAKYGNPVFATQEELIDKIKQLQRKFFHNYNVVQKFNGEWWHKTLDLDPIEQVIYERSLDLWSQMPKDVQDSLNVSIQYPVPQSVLPWKRFMPGTDDDIRFLLFVISGFKENPLLLVNRAGPYLCEQSMLQRMDELKAKYWKNLDASIDCSTTTTDLKVFLCSDDIWGMEAHVSVFVPSAHDYDEHVYVYDHYGDKKLLPKKAVYEEKSWLLKKVLLIQKATRIHF